MGFLDFLFGGNKEVKSLREEITKEFAALKQEMQAKQSAIEKENSQILSVLASFESDMEILRHEIRMEKKPNIPDARTEKRIAILEKMAEAVKVAGKLSLQNYDSIKSMESALKKIDALEKALKEYIATAPEIILSKDEYSEEIEELKKRLEVLESRELIVIGPQKRQEKRRK